MAPRVRENILKISPYKAGESKIEGVDRIIKLSSNENTAGPSPRAIEALRDAAADVSYYPEPSSRRLREALADHWAIEADRIITGTGSQKRIRPEDKFEDVYLDQRKMQYLYKSADKYVFMDMETYEQPELTEDVVGDATQYLKENDECSILFYEGQVVSLDLPANVTLKVEYTEPGVKGDTVQNVTKPATLETGIEVKVPNHINIGDNVKIDTRTGDFVERVNS